PQQPVRARDQGDLDAEGREDVHELGTDEPAADDDHPARELLEPHHGVAGVVGDVVQPRDVRDPGASSGRHHDLVGGDLLGAVRGLHGELLDTGEPGQPGVEGDVRVLLGPVAAAALGDGVDPAEDAVPDVRPPDLLQLQVDPQPGAGGGSAGDVGGVHEHLRRYAADVQAGAAVGVGRADPLVNDCHAPVGEPVVEDRVPGTGADDDQVEVPHWSILS